MIDSLDKIELTAFKNCHGTEVKLSDFKFGEQKKIFASFQNQ